MKRTIAFLLFLGAMAVLLLQMRGYFERDPRAKNYKHRQVREKTNDYNETQNTEEIIQANTSELAPDSNSDKQGDPVPGSWKITKSFDLNGTSYEGAIKFSKRGAGYHLQWNTNAGSYQGIALKNGNNLFVGWGNGIYGVAAYKINKDGTLSGKWMESKEGTAGTENLSGGKANVIEGTYKVNGSMSEKAYQGGLTIKKTGSVYQIDWQLKPSGPKGVGIIVGGYLVVGWGYGTSFGVVNYAIKGNKMLGRWTIGAADREGIENLKKMK